ncbi:MAG: hypothetical protein AAF518_03085 [Spirochaetota bacterium]
MNRSAAFINTLAYVLFFQSMPYFLLYSVLLTNKFSKAILISSLPPITFAISILIILIACGLLVRANTARISAIIIFLLLTFLTLALGIAFSDWLLTLLAAPESQILLSGFNANALYILLSIPIFYLILFFWVCAKLLSPATKHEFVANESSSPSVFANVLAWFNISSQFPLVIFIITLIPIGLTITPEFKKLLSFTLPASLKGFPPASNPLGFSLQSTLNKALENYYVLGTVFILQVFLVFFSSIGLLFKKNWARIVLIVYYSIYLLILTYYGVSLAYKYISLDTSRVALDNSFLIVTALCIGMPFLSFLWIVIGLISRRVAEPFRKASLRKQNI